MNIEFKLTIDSEGEPIIEFLCHDKSDLLEHKLLQQFIKKVNKSGIQLIRTSQNGDTAGKFSYDQYELRAGKNTLTK